MPGFSCPWRCLKLLEPFVDWTNVYGALCIIHLERFQTKYEFVYSHSAVLHLQTQFNFSFFFLRNIESSLKAFGLWNIRIITYAFLDYRLVLNSFYFTDADFRSREEKRVSPLNCWLCQNLFCPFYNYFLLSSQSLSALRFYNN